jgi:O-antigen ligase
VTAAVCLFGIYQFIGDCVGLPLRLTGLRDLYAKGVFGYPRIQSVALEPLYFSNYLLFPLAVSTKRMLKAEKPLRNWYTGLVLLIGVNLILGVSRSAYMALAAAVLFVAFWVGWQYYRGNMQRLSRLRNWGQVVLVGIGSLIVSFALLTIFTSPVATNRFLGHSMVDDTKVGTSIPGRLQTYGKAITFFREHPIVGIGIGDFGPRTVTSAANLTQYGYGIVNNEYLEIAAELGLLGLIAFFSVVYFYGREIWHGFSKMAEEDKWQNVLVLAALLAMLVQYSFFSTLYIIYIWAYLAWIRAEACSM